MRKPMILGIMALLCCHAFSQIKKPRARDLAIPFDGKPGRHNAITDVPGVLVGYKTLIKDETRTGFGNGPVRTGVTVIFPKEKTNAPVPAGWFSLNGDGEMTGLVSIDDYGLNYGPIGITNTYSVGVVHDASANGISNIFQKTICLTFPLAFLL